MAPEDDRYKGASSPLISSLFLMTSSEAASSQSILLNSTQLNAITEIPPRYHSAFVLDDASAVKGTGGSFGYPATLFKVIPDTINPVLLCGMSNKGIG
jgi:hypothetical protein